MTVPIAIHQFLVQGEEKDADLQPRCQSDQRNCFARPDMPCFEFFHEGYNMRRRRGVAVAVDRDHGVVPGLSPNESETFGHAFAYRARRRLMGDDMVDVVQRDAYQVKYFVQQQRSVRHRCAVNTPCIGEHSRTGFMTVRIRKAQSAVVGNRGETGK